MLSSQSKKPSNTMRRKQNGEILVAPEIPLDLQFEILKRLPCKSLARFKCVSKFWSSLIHSQGYLFPSSPSLIHSQAPGKYALLSLASTSKSKSTAFHLDMGIEGYLRAVLRGLILYEFCGQVCIYNLTTRQRVTLPPHIFTEKKYRRDYFFGYDPVLDQYKVVLTALAIYGQHWVFVLEPRSSWKRIEFDNAYYTMTQGLCINGVIYYLASTDVSGDYNIISFDVRYEEFNRMELPHAMSADLNDDPLELIEYGGKPTIFDYTHLKYPSGLLNLWVLEDVGKWSNKPLVLQPCQMHFFPDNMFFRVIGTTQNGEVVFKPEVMSSPYYILYYDLHENDVKRVDIRGISGKLPELALIEGENIMHLKI